MPKIKKCQHCGEVLYCAECGKRWTPDLKRGGREASVSLSNEMKESLAKEAKAKGLTVVELVELKLKGSRREARSKNGD